MHLVGWWSTNKLKKFFNSYNVKSIQMHNVVPKASKMCGQLGLKENGHFVIRPYK